VSPDFFSEIGSFLPIALQGGQGCGFAASWRFAYLAQIDYVEICELAEGGRRETDALPGSKPWSTRSPPGGLERAASSRLRAVWLA